MSGASLRLAACGLVFLLACTGTDPSGGVPGPQGTTTPSSSVPAGEISFGFLSEPATLDPLAASASELTFALARPLYPSLFLTMPDGSIEPMLAESFEERPNGIDVRLHEASWSNGDPITARDVVRSWRNVGHNRSGYSHFRRAVASGDRTVAFRGARSFRPEFEAWLATAAFVLPGGRFDRDVSGGPFRITRYVAGSRLDLEPNPRYFGAPASLERLTVRFVEDSTTLLGLVRQSRLDAAQLPSSVNLGARLDELDIEHESALGHEQIGLMAIDENRARGVAAALDLKLIEEALIRDEGELIAKSDGAPPTSAVLAHPRGDELLYLLARAAHFQGKDRGVTFDLAEIEARLLYAGSIEGGDVELIRRMAPPTSRASAGFVPLFGVRTFIARRAGVEGIEVNPTLEGPLWNAATWTASD